MPRKVQVMFDQVPATADPPRRVYEAIVAEENALPWAAWPMGPIHEALGHYNANRQLGDVAQIYAVFVNGSNVGYMIRSGGLTQTERDQLFWEIMADADMGRLTDDGCEYVTGDPFWVNGWQTFENGDQVPVGLVGYVEPQGNPAFPAEALNQLFGRLMGQTNFPRTMALFPYLVQKDDTSPISGLWIAERRDGLAFRENTGVDDKRFKAIRASNGLFRPKHPSYPVLPIEV